MTEINEVVYPQQFDTVQNFPSVTEISESSGEEINRNRDAILVLERTLGRNPQIGRYTVDPNTATVSQRIDILENVPRGYHESLEKNDLKFAFSGTSSKIR